MQKMAGSIGDGLLTASITTPEFVRYSRKNMEKARERLAKIRRGWCSARSLSAASAAIPPRAKKARANRRPCILPTKSRTSRARPTCCCECAGLTFDELRPVADAMEKGGRKAAAKAVTDDILRKVCPIAGTPEECIERIEEYRAAGCTHIMLEIWGDDRTGQAKLFGEAVLPHFRR